MFCSLYDNGSPLYYKSLGATWHSYRYEFALQRGSIHCHGPAKLKNDPGLCELSQLALKGFLAKESLHNDPIAHSEEEILELKSSIECGLKAEETICRYVDSLVTIMTPNHPDKHSWVCPKVQPCKNRLSEIRVEQQHADYNDLVNCVQRHTNCSSAYCLRKDDKGSQTCRFKYPTDECNETLVQFEKITTKDGAERYRAVVVTKTNDSRLNRHQQFQSQGWRANCDIDVVTDYHSCIEYLAKYASKGEKLSSVVRDVFASAVRNLNVATPQQHGKAIQSLMMKALGQRDMIVQEVMHQLLSLKFFSSSFNIITASLEGSRKLSRENNDIITELSTLDHYATRENFKNNYPGIMTLNFLQFVSNYFVKNDALHKRNNAVIVHTVPSYNCNSKSHDYPLYCKYQF